MKLELVSPSSAWLLLMLLPMALVLARSGVYMARRARLQLGLLRAAAVVLLVAALVDPRLTKEERGKGQGVAIAIDVSDSVGPERAGALLAAAVSRWRAWSAALGPGGELKLAVFGREAIEVPAERLAAEDEAEARARMETARSGPGKQSSNLAAALAWAREAFPPQTAVRLFVASDGRPTRGDLEAELDSARLAGTRIFPLPVEAAEADPLWVEELQAPAQVFAGDEYAVAARIVSAKAGSVRVALRKNGTLVEKAVVPVVAGTTVWSHKLVAEAAGSSALEVQVDPIDVPDTHPENDLYSAFTRARQVPKVLIASREPAGVAGLAKALTDSNLGVTVGDFRAVPDGEAALAGWSALVLDSPGGQDLSYAQQEATRRFVEKHGGGLLLIASKESVVKGSTLRDTLEHALPVYLVPRSEESPFALYLLLDSSGSMAGAPIAQVKFAAKRLISLMSGRHLGVIHFDSQPHDAILLQQVGTNRIAVETDIDSIQAMGGTAFTPALDRAFQRLKDYGTTQNHIMLLSDGQPVDEAQVPTYYPYLNKYGIKVSTIGIGAQVNQGLLKRIAAACGGQYYEVTDLTQVVSIFEKEVERLVGPPYEDRTFQPVVRPKHFLAKGLAGKKPPELHGYLGTSLKPGADAALETDSGDPVLASWQYGLGRAAIWTAGLRGPWMRGWRGWTEGFTPFWEGVVKALVRTELSRFKLSLSLDGKRATATVDAVDHEGRFLNGEKLELAVRPPGNAPPLRLPVQQVEEGRYEASFPVEARGFHAVVLTRAGPTGDEVVNEGGIALGYDPEYYPAPADRGALARMASQTGGSLLRDLDDVALQLVREESKVRPVSQPLWPWLAALAALVFLAEVALRRLTKVFVSEVGELDGEGGGAQATYLRIAENYQRMADDFEARGDPVQAQAHYLKARSFFLKANQEGVASRMWEKYRRLERR